MTRPSQTAALLGSKLHASHKRDPPSPSQWVQDFQTRIFCPAVLSSCEFLVTVSLCWGYRL